MADKKITELQPESEIQGSDVIPYDNGIQTFKITALNLAAGIKDLMPADDTFDVDLTGSGDFDSGHVYGWKNSLGWVFLHFEGLTWTAEATPQSAAGIIPAAFRPAAGQTSVAQTVQNTSNTIFCLFVTSAGGVNLDCRDFAGGAKSDATQLFFPVAITFKVTT